MYIIDCLYGKIEFEKKEYRCMISPEMQRLREVRLGNINSLCLTGSSNNNRYEHSVGTAFLAKVNIEANKKTFPSEYKEAFVLAALFHDLGNGPFGHSYEYLVQRNGFVPETSIAEVIFGSTTGAHAKSVKCEPFYLGLQNELSSILSRKEVMAIDKIVKGENPFCSKLLSSVIDIDNIDNVYRMAFHMGLPVDKKAPLELAKGLVCLDNSIFFRKSAIPYLYDWYETRSKLYELLLYNPQDFAAKCMLEELMETVLKRENGLIKWQFTDSQLLEVFLKKKEEYWEDDALVPISLEGSLSEEDFSSEDRIRGSLKKLGIEVPEKASICIEKEQNITRFSYYSVEFEFRNGNLFKKAKRIVANPSKLAARLMRGDLYACIGIFVSPDVDRYDIFADHSKKEEFETKCNYYLENRLKDKKYAVCFHGIIDKNKTNRQLEIKLETGELFDIGKNTNNLLIGYFVKNDNCGLSHGDISSKKREELDGLIRKFLELEGFRGEKHTLYSEVSVFERRNN